jgi:ATP-binding cassette subfamily B protein
MRARAAPKYISTGPLLAGLWHALTQDRRKRVGMTLLLLVGAGSTEFGALFALRHFLTALTRANAEGQMIEPSLVFAASVVALAIARLITLKRHDALVLDFACDSSIEIFSRALRQPYLDHVRGESAELFAALDNMQRLVTGALGPLVQALVNAALAAALLLFLLILAPFVTLTMLCLLALSYWLIGRLTGGHLQRGSHELQSLAIRRLKIVHEAQSGFRDLALTHAQALTTEHFAEMERAYRTRQARDRFAAMAPRYVIEMAVLLTVTALACLSAMQPEGIKAGIPLIGVMVLGLQRLMPLVNGCYTGWALFQANSAVLADILRLIHRPSLPEGNAAAHPLPFKHAITLEAVGLRYESREAVLRDANLTIRKGERVGIIGASGSGKSSLLDILLGLFEPNEGRVIIDDVPLDTHELRWQWQMQLACVPQSVYLRDASIRDLIAQSATNEPVDQARFSEAIRGAKLESLLLSLPSGADTRVGDGGLLLSGGQRQRLAIARALYRRAQVLVLDEATSQLDIEAEEEIVDTLDTLDRTITILIVTHRRAALRGCDRIIEVRDGTVVEANEVAAA